MRLICGEVCCLIELGRSAKPLEPALAASPERAAAGKAAAATTTPASNPTRARELTFVSGWRSRRRMAKGTAVRLIGVIKSIFAESAVPVTLGGGGPGYAACCRTKPPVSVVINTSQCCGRVTATIRSEIDEH